MSDEIKTTEDIALENLNIIDHFNFGHNLLRSPATIEQIFEQLIETIKPVVEKYKYSISDINIAVYDRDSIVVDKVNICWSQLPGTDTYLILVNPYVGSTYVTLTDEVKLQLLLNGKTVGGWYLLNQIDCIQTFITSSDNTIINVFFESILTAVTKFIFDTHISDYSLNAHYTLQFNEKLETIPDDVDDIISNIQIKASATTLDNSGVSYIYTDTGIIQTYSPPPTALSEFNIKNIPQIITSEYLLKKSDIAAILKNTTKQQRESNVKFFYVYAQFNIAEPPAKKFEFADNMYSVSSQLIGKFKINYTDGTTVEISPTCQASPIIKTPNEIFFLIMLQSNNYLSKTINSIESEDVMLLYSLTGKINY